MNDEENKDLIIAVLNRQIESMIKQLELLHNLLGIPLLNKKEEEICKK